MVHIITGLRLVGGSSDYEGNVFIGSLPVCDDGWDMRDANVVCRQLGLGDAIGAPKKSAYGSVPDNFVMSYVRCTGYESSIAQCGHSYSSHCGENDGAGVVCSGVTVINSEGEYPVFPTKFLRI